MSNKQELDFSPLEQSFGYRLRRAQLLSNKHLSDQLQALNLTPTSFSLLHLIHANPGQTQTALGNKLGIKRANMVSLINLLEGLSLVERKQSLRDSRSVAIMITKKGKKTLEKAMTVWRIHDEEIRAALGDDASQQSFGDQLDRFIRHFVA